MIEMRSSSRGYRFRCRCCCGWVGGARRDETDAVIIGDDHLKRIERSMSGGHRTVDVEERTGEGREHLEGDGPPAA